MMVVTKLPSVTGMLVTKVTDQIRGVKVPIYIYIYIVTYKYIYIRLCLYIYLYLSIYVSRYIYIFFENTVTSNVVDIIRFRSVTVTVTNSCAGGNA